MAATILVAEDQADIRELLVMNLRGANDDVRAMASPCLRWYVPARSGLTARRDGEPASRWCCRLPPDAEVSPAWLRSGISAVRARAGH
jgi:CheY-like chemotaxis protein